MIASRISCLSKLVDEFGKIYLVKQKKLAKTKSCLAYLFPHLGSNQGPPDYESESISFQPFLFFMPLCYCLSAGDHPPENDIYESQLFTERTFCKEFIIWN